MQQPLIYTILRSLHILSFVIVLLLFVPLWYQDYLFQPDPILLIFNLVLFIMLSAGGKAVHLLIKSQYKPVPPTDFVLPLLSYLFIGITGFQFVAITWIFQSYLGQLSILLFLPAVFVLLVVFKHQPTLDYLNRIESSELQKHNELEHKVRNLQVEVDQLYDKHQTTLKHLAIHVPFQEDEQPLVKMPHNFLALSIVNLLSVSLIILLTSGIPGVSIVKGVQTLDFSFIFPLTPILGFVVCFLIFLSFFQMFNIYYLLKWSTIALCIFGVVQAVLLMDFFSLVWMVFYIPTIIFAIFLHVHSPTVQYLRLDVSQDLEKLVQILEHKKAWFEEQIRLLSLRE